MSTRDQYYIFIKNEVTGANERFPKKYGRHDILRALAMVRETHTAYFDYCYIYDNEVEKEKRPKFPARDGSGKQPKKPSAKSEYRYAEETRFVLNSSAMTRR